MKSRAAAERLLSVLSPIVLLVIWEVLVRVGLLDARFFPAPSRVLLTLWELVETGELWRDLGASLYRVGVGMLVGSAPALLLGMVMGLSRWIRAALNPMVAAIYPIPKTAILPLIMLIFGLGETAKIVIVATGVFFLVLINTMAGVMHIDPIYFDVGRTFEASRWRMLRTVAIPGALPLIMAGIRLGVGTALILIVVAEFSGARSGVGYMIWNAWQIFAVERMYAGLIVISLLGYLATLLLEEVERLLVPWKAN